MTDVETGEGELWEPPWWLLVFAPLCWLLIAALVLQQRGWVVALVAFVLLAPVGMPIPALLRWIRRHRRLEGAYLGPLAFSGVAIVTDVPVWVCASAGLTAVLLVLFLGAMRDFTHA